MTPERAVAARIVQRGREPARADSRRRPGRLLAAAAALALTGALLGCASVPDVDDLIRSQGSEGAPRLAGSRGPLSERQSKAVLARLESQVRDSDMLQRHLAIEEAISDTPLVVGNRVRVLSNGAETFQAMFDAIRGAKDHVNLEYYIIEDVESGGQKLSDLLVEKRREGVKVNILYDGFGSAATPPAFFDRLSKAGVKLLQFNPVDPLESHGGYAPNDRDHRKILIADGRTAIVGGVNLSTVYQSGMTPQKKKDAAGLPPGVWRDTDVEIDGPAVADLQRLFLDHWAKQNGPPLEPANFYPAIPAMGRETVRIIGSSPSDTVPRYYATLLSAIRTAEQRIWIATAYFVPTHQEMEDLLAAARRGVDVELLLPGKSDSSLALAVGHSHYEDLLEAGVKIYETRGEILHSKTAVIDGAWSVVGSSNFDHRSVLFNDEVDAVILGRDTAAQLEKIFRDGVKEAAPIGREAWSDRPIGEKLEEYFSLAWQTLL
jgi:cardiolipin synthase